MKAIYNYKVNAVIVGLIERRRCHQKNMLKATCLISVITLLTSSILLHLSLTSSESKIKDVALLEINKIEMISPGNSQRESINNIKNVLPYQHDGFAGFNGYKISPITTPEINLRFTSNNQKVLFQTADIYIEDFRNEISYLTDMKIESFGNGDFGLPNDNTLIQIASDKFPAGKYSSKTSTTEPDEPALIKLTVNPRHPSNAYKKSGLVVLEFIITKKGVIKDRKVLYEAPLNFGFAPAVLSALNEAYYWPAKNNGIPIDTKVTLTWDMCWECNFEITYSDDRLIVTKD